MDIQINTLSIADLDRFFLVFVRVMKSEFPGYSADIIQFFLEKIYTRSSFFYWLENKMKTVFIAKKGNDIIGFAVIDEPYGGVSFCRWLGVLKEYQHQGAGGGLIKAWIDLAIKSNCHKAEVASAPEAKAFYEKVGLELEGMRKLSYFGIDQYFFGKVISEPNEKMMIK